MTQTYYDNPDANYPHVILSTLDALKYHVATHLYPTEDYQTSSKLKMLRANFEVGTEHGLRASIKQFNNVSAEFPFTAYNISETEESEIRRNMYHTGGSYYSKKYETYLKALPIVLNVQMMSFFTEPSDYYHAEAILMEMNGKLQRLVVPIDVNGEIDAFTADVRLEIAKGNLAFQYEENRERGRIYDITHNAVVLVHYFIMPDVTIYPVDDIEAGIGHINQSNPDDSIPKETFFAPDTPKVDSTSPNNGDTGVDPSANNTTITMNFNVEMDEISVENFLNIYPYISGNYTWDDQSKQLTIELIEDLDAATEYTFFLASSAKSFYQHEMADDYQFSFTTI